MRINRGKHWREKVARELNMLRVSCHRPALPPNKKNAPTRFTSIKLKAIGNPVAIRTNRLPKMSTRANCHSTNIHLTVKLIC